MKVIDLLNKIAKGEEVPIEIEYRNKRYILNRTCKQYYEKGEGSYIDNKLAFKNTIEYEFYGDFLNDEVKIIEGQQDIDIQGIKELDENFTYYEDHSSGLAVEKVLNKAEIELVNKINELVQALKQLDKKIKEK